ncbi:S8 family serine peptidase [Cnuibacter physcomitrellae]|uniref:S8 family serine peptidase n=1 Tax=Cnuibacter physcomitrellae TaxID=1619308 RepID=UPI002175E952|nr:S8 family serine peptidase [Cnuibacter physcomitrellae]MCS5497953.1 S8 family serine peptidase [Cnuibacter physcomitrellae]
MRRLTRAVAQCAAVTIAAGAILMTAGTASAEPTAGGDPSEKLSGWLSVASNLDLSTNPAVANEQIDAATESADVLGAGPTGLQISEQGIAVTVYYSTTPSDADVAALAALGTVDDVAAKYFVIGATVPASKLDAVAALPHVTSVVQSLAPTTSGSAREAMASAVGAVPAAAADDCRTVPANLADPLNVPLAQELYKVDGSGVKVGIISDSFGTSTDALTTPAEDVAAGLLPGAGNPCGYTQPVQVVREAEGPGSDEGRAMAQLVHSIAPGATLAFASGGNSQVAFANSVEALLADGADIIVDDLGYLNELMFQDGTISNAVTEAESKGVPFFTAAGNDTSVGRVGPSTGSVISSWETPGYRPTDCPAVIATSLTQAGLTGDCLDFSPTGADDPTDQLLYPNLQGGVASIMLQWAQPFGAADTQLTGVVLDSNGAIVALSPFSGVNPVQVIQFQPTGGAYDFVVVRDTTGGASASLPRVKAIFLGSFLGGAEYYQSTGGDIVGPSIYGHAGTPSAVSVVAANAETPDTPEPFSGTGPTTLYFEPIPSTAALATPISGAPDVTGVDGGWTNFFSNQQPVSGHPGVYSFTGTSAAAPSVAAVAALGLQLNPQATPQQVRAALTSTAEEVPNIFNGVSSQDATGAGRVNAAAFLAALPPVPVPPAPVPVPVPAGGGGNATQLAATGAGETGSALGLGALVLLAGSVLLIGARRRATR